MKTATFCNNHLVPIWFVAHLPNVALSLKRIYYLKRIMYMYSGSFVESMEAKFFMFSNRWLCLWWRVKSSKTIKGQEQNQKVRQHNRPSLKISAYFCMKTFQVLLKV